MDYPARRSDAQITDTGVLFGLVQSGHWRRRLELKLRLLAGKVPTLRKYAHQQNLGNIEDELAIHFGDALSVAEKDMLRLCRQLRNKVLHSDFTRRAASSGNSASIRNRAA